MQNCPTCKAKLKGACICRRCKTDLTKALEVAVLAEDHFRSATLAFSDGHFEAMLYHARRSFSLHRTLQRARLLACAALLQGDYLLALNTWAVISATSPSE
jgi:hypothetical protein